MDTLNDGSESSAAVLILAHGAGAPMDSPFMRVMASLVAASGIRVVRFEFPYMAARRKGQRRPPDRGPVLRRSWLEIIDRESGGGRRICIGGKSMGGRIASMVADEAGVDGLVCLGYPFHPPGQLERLRTAHLEDLRTRALIVQGTRDTFGTREEVEGYRLSTNITLQWIEDGDHSLKPRKASGRNADEALREAAAAVVAFVQATTAMNC